jgi:hypothetical protein
MPLVQTGAPADLGDLTSGCSRRRVGKIISRAAAEPQSLGCRMKSVRLTATVCVSVTLACSPAVTYIRDEPLAQGPFIGLDGARLGAGGVFQNDIDSRTCFPLEVNGQTTAWLTAAHVAGDRILVRRCEKIEEGALSVRHGYWGWAPPEWDEIVRGPDGALRFQPLVMPRWTFLANPAFCGMLVAYWAVEDDLEDDAGERSILRPTVFDLADGSIVQAGTLGSVELRTDWEGFLGPPVWNSTCRTAQFDGEPVERERMELTVRR